MSIASELEDLATNLTNANTAIVEKGGTASTTGFSGLANAVDTIETGGGGGLPDDPETNYGAVMYYSRWANEYSATNTSNCTVNSIDQSKLATWISNHSLTTPIDFNYNWEGQWEVMAEWEPITINNLKAETGIDATLIDPEAMYGSFKIVYGINVDTTSPITAGTLTQTEYTNLGTLLDGATATSKPATLASRVCSVAGVSVPVAAFVRFVFGSLNGSTPSGFLAGANIESISEIPSTNSSANPFTVGDGFLSWCDHLNSPVIFKGQSVNIGDRFMNGCTAFASTLSFGPGPETIAKFSSGKGENFMRLCKKFVGPLQVFTAITAIPDYFMNGCWNYSGRFDFPEAVTVGNYFFSMTSSYTSVQGWTVYDDNLGSGVTFNFPKATTIGNNFFVDQMKFNTPWQLPSVTTIGSNFMAKEYNSFMEYQRDVTIPQTVTSIKDKFLFGQYYAITVDVGNLDPTTVLRTTGNNAKSLTAGEQHAPAYSTGIKIKGAQRAAWITALPQRSTSPFRKLVDAGA